MVASGGPATYGLCCEGREGGGKEEEVPSREAGKEGVCLRPRGLGLGKDAVLREGVRSLLTIATMLASVGLFNWVRANSCEVVGNVVARWVGVGEEGEEGFGGTGEVGRKGGKGGIMGPSDVLAGHLVWAWPRSGMEGEPPGGREAREGDEEEGEVRGVSTLGGCVFY